MLGKLQVLGVRRVGVCVLLLNSNDGGEDNERDKTLVQVYEALFRSLFWNLDVTLSL